MAQQLTTLGAFQQAWQIYKERWISLTLSILLPGLVAFILVMLFVWAGFVFGLSLVSELPVLAIVLPFLGFGLLNIGFLIFLPVLYAAMIYIIKGRKGEVGFLKGVKMAFKKFWPIFGVSLLSGLLIAFSGLFFVIPGIFLSWLFSFSMFVLIDEDLEVIESLGKSSDYFLSNWKSIVPKYLLLSLFSLVVFVVPASILSIYVSETIGALATGIIMLFAPVYLVCFTHAIYENIKHKNQATTT